MSLPLQPNRFLTRRAMYLPPLFVQTVLQKTLATNVWSLSNKNILVHSSQDKKKIFRKSCLLLNSSHYLCIHHWQSCSNIFFKCLLFSLLFKISELEEQNRLLNVLWGKKCFNLKNHLHENCKLSTQKWRTQLFMQHNRSNEIHGRSD